jgi:hypothetical protein
MYAIQAHKSSAQQTANLLGAVAAQNQQRFIQAASHEITEPMAVGKNIVWDRPEAAGWWHATWHHLTCPWVYEHVNPPIY